MHTITVLVGAFLLLAILIATARALGVKGSFVATGAQWFIPLWFLGAALNMYVGISRAGYTFMEELPMFFVVFGLPSIVAGLLWWKAGAKTNSGQRSGQRRAGKSDIRPRDGDQF